jgi:farnesyl diphosphate synthase
VPSLDEHRALIEDYLAELPFAKELGALTDAMRYSLDGGGKRVRPLLCLACGVATGSQAEDLLPAAAAVELVHTFGMVHDDLPALDDDAIRRGRATSHVQFDEATAILNGDALLAQAQELALSYSTPAVARELAWATLGINGGQYDDITGDGDDLERRHALKTGRLFEAAVGCALAVSEVPQEEQVPWRGFAAEFGLLYQVVDDVLDEDGLAAELGVERTHELAAEIEERSRARLAEIPADTSLLDELASGLRGRIPRFAGS